MPGTPLQGYIAAAGSALAFGSFAVPVKNQAVLDAKVDPVVFQCYKSLACFLHSWITLAWVDLVFTPWGLVGAGMWVITGILAIIAIRKAGLGIAQSTWAGLGTVIAFLWGAFVFHEAMRDMPRALIGLVLLVTGIVGSGLAAGFGFRPEASTLEDDAEHARLNMSPLSDAPEHAEAVQQHRPAPAMTEQAPIMQERSLSSLSVEGSGHELSAPGYGAAKHVSSRATSKGIGSFLLGLAVSAAVGVSAGSFNVPFEYATDVHGAQYIVSFGCGAVVASFVSLLVYFSSLWMLGRPVPSFHVRIAAGPAMLAGLLWATGNLLSILAIDALGLSIGTSVIQCQLIVSNLWALLYYHELQGRTAAVAFALATLVLLSGVWLVAYFGR